MLTDAKQWDTLGQLIVAELNLSKLDTLHALDKMAQDDPGTTGPAFTSMSKAAWAAPYVPTCRDYKLRHSP